MMSDRFYLPQLDGLRFTAFAAVFFAHVTVGTRLRTTSWGEALASSGALGIDLFFVLSSFLITTLLLRERQQEGAVDVPAFWLRRILRIWPLYITVVGIDAVVERPPWTHTAALLLFAGNWAVLEGWQPYATGPLWSISVEEQFYLGWPLVLRRVRPRAVILICLALIAVAMATRAFMALLAPEASYTLVWCHTLARLDPIAIGGLLAVLGPRCRLPAWTRPVVGAGGAVLLVVVTHAWPFATPPRLAGILSYLVVALAFGAVVAVTLATPPGWLGHPVLVYLGRISYGLYVLHEPAIRAVQALGSLTWPVRISLEALATLGLAALSYRILERPFLRLKRRFTHVRSAPV